MQLVKFFSLLSIAATAAVAVDIRFYAARSCSGGSYASCTNISGAKCCNLASTPAAAILFTGVPSGCEVVGYAGQNCGTRDGILRGSGNLCYLGGSALFSGMWSKAFGRQAISQDGADCATPDVFVYTGTDGLEHTIQINDNAPVELLFELANDADWEGLAAIESTQA
ncbi:hypothetical protein CC1G_12047 [Coprinopsis cinerea okayama7|uniref:Uncharacterized protein n=1 Tax=Coprinopsis cinerea (strain Okayama-7 / 130 / ATCC MYA-4618 / FGSC 9003) TaxID=240176 RepID=A8N9K9_COPC7|nr:hypothetical protein CC1G_12047 [Coprinopsis cinerea okayama7\|eukprot:XP_001831515.1 hypothetical protein CC1G_12047 [Coprinopsis cinerea okayama7\